MKTNTFKSTAALWLLLCFTACADKEITPPDDITGEVPTEPSTGKPEMKYKLQTSQELILSDRILCKDGIVILDLSEEEAKTLQIPSGMYQQCMRHVEKLNLQTMKD